MLVNAKGKELTHVGEQCDVPDAARHGVTEMMCDFHNILRAKFPVRRAGNRQPLGPLKSRTPGSDIHFVNTKISGAYA